MNNLDRGQFGVFWQQARFTTRGFIPDIAIDRIWNELTILQTRIQHTQSTQTYVRALHDITVGCHHHHSFSHSYYRRPPLSSGRPQNAKRNSTIWTPTERRGSRCSSRLCSIDIMCTHTRFDPSAHRPIGPNKNTTHKRTSVRYITVGCHHHH